VASSSRASSLAPWHHLGALGFFLFWIVAATGIYVYAFFDPSVAGAHASLERLSREQWWLGGLMRSLHRYASDAFVVVALAHLAKEALAGHFRGFRWFSWTTGVVLLWFIYFSGVVGYWLVWDRVGQFSATATAEWFDALGLGAAPMVRNFLTPAEVTDRLFSLFVFLHIGVPLALLAAMWVHIQRIAHTGTNPPPRLGWATLGLLLALSLARPVHSDAPAEYGALAPQLPLDWFYLFAHPLMYATSPEGLWGMAAAATLALLCLPLLFSAKRDAAFVNLSRCTGCGHCAHDCPYLAISMVPRSDGRPFLKQAVVRAEQCAACGICAGSCPTAVPPPRGAVAAGIDLPGKSLQTLKDRLDALDISGQSVIFHCRHAKDAPAAGDGHAVALECAAQLPPSFADYALRRGAKEIVVAACAPGACEYRLGRGWTEARIAGSREPHLNPLRKNGVRVTTLTPASVLLAAAALVAATVAIAYFSFAPRYRPLGEREALVRVIVAHAGERLAPCRRLSEAELAARAPNMRAPEECPRGRHPVPVRIELGGRVLVDERLAPSGIAKDGEAQLYRSVRVPAGRQALRARVADAPRTGARAWERAEDLDLAPGQVLTIDFRPGEGGILLP
jgi:ferredoxin